MIDNTKKYASNTEYQHNAYDMICVRLGKGQRKIVQEIASEEHRSVSNYMKHLIIKDAQKKGKNIDISAFIGGGRRGKMKE